MEIREFPVILGAIVVVIIDYWVSGRLNLDTIAWKAVVGGILGQIIFAAIQKTVEFLRGHFFFRRRAR